MPVHELPLPLKGVDRRDSIAIQNLNAADARAMRSRDGKLSKYGGTVRLGAANAFSGQTVRNFAQAYFTDGVERLYAIGDGLLREWDGSSWVANISGAGGRATVPTSQRGRFAVLNTLDKLWINPGAGATSATIAYYDRAIGAPSDLLELSSGSITTRGIGATLRSNAMVGFANRVILIHTWEGTTEYPTRIRWCRNGDGDVWVPGTNESATPPENIGAGLLEVIETSQQPLTGGFVLGERCYLTKHSEILELIATGGVNPTFRVESRIPGIGMAGPFMVACVGHVAYFLGSDYNFYAYDGSSIRVIGEQVRAAIRSDYDFVSANKIHRTVVHALPSRNEIILCDVFTGSVQLVYDIVADAWWRDQHSMSVFDIARGSSAVLGPGSAARQDFLLLYNDTSKTAFYADDDANDRNGETFEAYIETKDITTRRRSRNDEEGQQRPDLMNLLHEIMFRADASRSVEVGVSLNEGAAITSGPFEADFTGRTMQRLDGGDFGADGWLPGMSFALTGDASGTSNNGTYEIESVEGDVIHVVSPFPHVKETLGIAAIMTMTTTAAWALQTVTTNKDGVGRAFFILPFSKFRTRFRTNDALAFNLRGIWAFRWEEGGPEL